MSISQDVIAVALIKILGKNGPELQPGNYGFCGRVTLDVNATITKGEPEEYTPTTSLPIKKVLAIALQKAGVQRDRIESIITEAAQEALLDGEPIGDYLPTTEAALERVEALLAKLPPKTRDGKTTVRGTVQVIRVKPAS